MNRISPIRTFNTLTKSTVSIRMQGRVDYNTAFEAPVSHQVFPGLSVEGADRRAELVQKALQNLSVQDIFLKPVWKKPVSNKYEATLPMYRIEVCVEHSAKEIDIAIFSALLGDVESVGMTVGEEHPVWVKYETAPQSDWLVNRGEKAQQVLDETLRPLLDKILEQVSVLEA